MDPNKLIRIHYFMNFNGSESGQNVTDVDLSLQNAFYYKFRNSDILRYDILYSTTYSTKNMLHLWVGFLRTGILDLLLIRIRIRKSIRIRNIRISHTAFIRICKFANVCSVFEEDLQNTPKIRETMM